MYERLFLEAVPFIWKRFLDALGQKLGADRCRIKWSLS